MSSPERILEVRDLQVSVGDHLVAVHDVSFAIGRGESVGLVGESGSGKTLTCRAVLGLLPATGDAPRRRKRRAPRPEPLRKETADA